ncbi:hypothetical protein DLM76_19135 [Leptospira yasudae]|uniref:Uncharacterized protein n=1 Tax=Leptospira yasudae TaxID=2202201 RepID=A0ABX9M0P2_9LEPT|nr:hypothetical protein DLM77_17295 [Leptospira yasudae]RHX91267.1 hypothetical protein DLM76_19135 [Leptospira yasudae]
MFSIWWPFRVQFFSSFANKSSLSEKPCPGSLVFFLSDPEGCWREKWLWLKKPKMKSSGNCGIF